jgi:hypothetical protein
MLMKRLAAPPLGLCLLALILLATWAQATPAQTRWQQFSGPDDDFTIDFPAPPEHSIIPTGSEGEGDVEFYAAAIGGQVLSIGYHDGAPQMNVTSRQSLNALAEGCRLYARAGGRKLLRLRALPGGVIECMSTGRSLDPRYKTDRRLERTLVRGRRYYTLSVTSWTEAIDMASATRFFSSFRLTSPLGPAAATGAYARPDAAPLTPRYEYDNAAGLTRVTLPSSPAGGVSGPYAVSFGARYVFDKDWRRAGTLNEVMLMFDVTGRGEVCPGRCRLTLTADGESDELEVTARSVPLDGGGTLQMVSVSLRPQSFRRLAGARAVGLHLGDVSFRLTDAQMDGLRKMVPFLNERLLP